MLINVKTNQQIEEEMALATKAVDISESTEMVNSFSEYISQCWEEAKKAKKDAEARLLANKRQIKGIYSPEKLAAIKEFGSSEIFVYITDTKCRNANAWVCDILFQPNEKCWGIKPTPQPELPEHIKGRLLEVVSQDVLAGAISTITAGGDADPLAVYQEIMSKLPEIEENLKEYVQREALKISEKMEEKINDQLSEGGWYSAMSAVIPDVVAGTGFIKGPVLRKQRVKKPSIDPATGKFSVSVVERAIPKWEVRSPFYIYPAPGSTGINDGYLFDRISITPQKLQELIGIPGFDSDEIRLVLSEFENNTLQNWLNLEIDRDLKTIEESGNENIQNLSYSSHKIDCLEFWDAIQGKKLKEWGVEQKEMKLEDELFYDVCAWKIGTHVIKIMFNPDKLGEKPFSKASFEEEAGSFWGTGLPEIISDVQQACNACARSIVNNVGIASGPQVERNVDRVPRSDIQDNIIYPWRVWDVTNQQAISNAPALKFYQPPMVVDKILSVFDRFVKIADEHSGVPAYAHGDVRVGGAGRTASGLSMLMQGAARGIKSLIRTLDNCIISPTITRQYFWNIEQKENFGLVCDFMIEAKGSSAMLAKEQQLARTLEFLQITANPLDFKLTGPSGRSYMLGEVARQFGLDVDKVLPMIKLIQEQEEEARRTGAPLPGEEQPAGGNQAGGPRMLDEAGNPAQGTDINSFESNRGNNMQRMR